MRLLTAKALSYSVAGVVLSLGVTVATMVVGTLILDSRGEATLGVGELADVLWRNLAVAAVLGPIGVGIGALVRNQIVTVVGLVAVAAVLEPAVFAGRPGGRPVRPARRRARWRPRRRRRARRCSRRASRSRSSSPGRSPRSRRPRGDCNRRDLV